ncbi:MAG: endolytic transglycosylase MltG [Pseudonocardiaceae bacterium]|nr:endolytic transglycosylase MltG [Pseudonocardiaceae bacterium]
MAGFPRRAARPWGHVVRDGGLELFDEEAARELPRRGGRSRRRRARMFMMAILIGVVVGAAWFGVQQVLGFGMFGDYEGPGEDDVLIEISPGQSIGAMGSKLAEADVVATSRAFISASEENGEVASIQPGYYVMKTRMSGEQAASRIVAPSSRVGQLQIRPGTHLHDIKQPDGSVTPGVLSKLSEASCADLNGKSTCVSKEQLRKTIEETDLAALGAPGWAAEDAAKADPKHRLEGLVMPGVYDVKPGLSAKELLHKVLSESSASLQAWGMPTIAERTGYRPYEVLIMASLIEREGVRSDFGKVSRVIYNRLKDEQKLQFDSTVNYVLDRPEVRTTAEDRGRAGPYNTYANNGLPPTPISSPGKSAIAAAAQPEEGPWRFFVKCYKNGISCFAETPAQHDANRREAQARGAY